MERRRYDYNYPKYRDSAEDRFDSGYRSQRPTSDYRNRQEYSDRYRSDHRDALPPRERNYDNYQRSHERSYDRSMPPYERDNRRANSRSSDVHLPADLEGRLQALAERAPDLLRLTNVVEPWMEPWVRKSAYDTKMAYVHGASMPSRRQRPPTPPYPRRSTEFRGDDRDGDDDYKHESALETEAQADAPAPPPPPPRGPRTVKQPRPPSAEAKPPAKTAKKKTKPAADDGITLPPPPPPPASDPATTELLRQLEVLRNRIDELEHERSALPHTPAGASGPTQKVQGNKTSPWSAPATTSALPRQRITNKAVPTALARAVFNASTISEMRIQQLLETHFPEAATKNAELRHFFAEYLPQAKVPTGKGWREKALHLLTAQLLSDSTPSSI